ncbi:MAG TPA: hypothetical protein VFS92_04615 [Planctomycetota bacterium]|nr:hypothetical protein [Planctomycetota bacterium]
MFPRPLRSALAAAAVLAAAAGHAAARAPRAEDHPSVDALLLRLQKEREQDQKTPTSQDAYAQYATGASALDAFKPLTDCIGDPRREQTHRERATTAIVDRFRVEFGKRAVDPRYDHKALEKARNGILDAVKDLMLKEEVFGRNQLHRLTSTLLEPSPLQWSPNDSPRKRQQAYAELKKRIS